MLDKFTALSFTEAQLEEIKNYYFRYNRPEVEPLSRDDFLEFSRTGNRVNYENKYFARRRRINSAFMMSRAYGGAYTDELNRLLYAVCGEDTWALPAHAPDPETARTAIDLFAAETGMMLAEIVYLAGNAVLPEVRERISREIRERIFVPFSENEFHWESAKHNWSAVCAGAIGVTYLREAPEDLPEERILAAMRAYLSGYGADGVCLEGVGYWSYGFGFYVYFAAELLRARGIDILHDGTAELAAGFLNSARLCGGVCVSCSDAPEEFVVPLGLAGMLKEFYGIGFPAGIKTARTDDCGRWAHYIRSWLYPAPSPERAGPRETVLKASQWYVNAKERYGFFLKGGNNAEPHNHNDIGSFIIADENGQILCDLGMGEYTRDYFDESRRYENLCTSSLGHSVPVIDGRGQLAGAEYKCGRFECGDDRAYVSFGGAYGSGIVAVRRFWLYEDRIIMRDTFDFYDNAPHSVTERFVTTVEPTFVRNGVFVGNMRIDRPVSMEKRVVRAHDGSPRTVYLLDIEVGGEFSVEFKFC